MNFIFYSNVIYVTIKEKKLFSRRKSQVLQIRRLEQITITRLNKIVRYTGDFFFIEVRYIKVSLFFRFYLRYLNCFLSSLATDGKDGNGWNRCYVQKLDDEKKILVHTCSSFHSVIARTYHSIPSSSYNSLHSASYWLHIRNLTSP